MDILIAADDLRIALLIASRLKREGHRTVSIHHLRHALAGVQSNTPDVVILVVGRAGLRMLKELRRCFAAMQVPVVLVTNETDETLDRRPTPARIFPAPPPMEQLVATIAELHPATKGRRDKDEAEVLMAEPAR